MNHILHILIQLTDNRLFLVYIVNQQILDYILLSKTNRTGLYYIYHNPTDPELYFFLL